MKMSINFVKVQIGDLHERAARNIVDPVVGKFSAIAVNGPETARVRFQQLLDYATEQELDVFWWYCPGYWNVLDLPAHCNIRSVWSDAPRDWTYFGLEEARNRTVQRAINLLSDFPDMAGILIDYIRYPWGIIGQRPDLFTADQIMETVEALYAAMQANHPGKLLIGNVATAPAYIRYGQAWPDWMDDGIVDGVNVRCYVLPSDLPEALAGIPNFGSKKQGVCMAPGGTEKIRPLTGEEVNEWLETADEFGFPVVSAFDFTRMDGYWQYIPRLPAGEPPPSTTRRFRIVGGYLELEEIVD
jgi:hypothetical protein